MIIYEVKFLTCDESLQLKNHDNKSFQYETKKRVEESVYDSGKRSYYERRGGLWRAAHPRQLRQLETKLRDKSIVYCQWSTNSLITIVLSSGVIAHLTVQPSTLDITQILFDKYLVGKLSGQAVTNVAVTKHHMLLTQNDRSAILVTFGKSNVSLPCRISDRDPHTQNIELGGSSRRSERRISCVELQNSTQVLVWSVTAAEPAPWSPVLEDIANLHLYNINGHHVTLTAYHQLENETLSAELSHKADNVVHIVEQINCHKSGINLTWLRFDVPSADIATKLSSCRDIRTRVSVSTPVRVVRRSPCDSRLLLACIDGSLHVVHCSAGLTHTTRAGFIATDVRWADELILAAEEGGRLQCFDRALSLLHHHTKCLDLTSYLKTCRRLQLLTTRSSKCGPIILAGFADGPLALLHISHPKLITAWLRAKRSSNAVALLRAMDWEREGTECLWAMNKIVGSTLRSKSEAWSGEDVCVGALGTFLRAPPASSASLPSPASLASPAARLAPPVTDLARKFHHHLLRRGRLEKALSLAVDLEAWDLFADVRWAATRTARSDLASEATELAHHYARTTDSECSESCSSCSHSGSESDEDNSNEHSKTKPPPLPRVPVNQPTLMQVPVSHSESISSSSIRPNLHQYLERDNSIWKRNIQESSNNCYEYPKPVRNSQTVRWHSMDVLSNYRPQKHTLLPISEASLHPAHSVVDVIPRQDDRHNISHFKHLYQMELREEAPNTLYRYNNNINYHPSTSSRMYKVEGESEKHGRTGEKNKVSFSDTVTINVMPEARVSPDPTRELAASLPLCLANFAQPPPGTTLDYVEV